MESIHPAHYNPSVDSQDFDGQSSPMLSLTKSTKNHVLYVGVLEEVRRARRCSDAGRKDLALKHLREALSLCDDYSGSLKLWQACQELEQELSRGVIKPDHARPYKRLRAVSHQNGASTQDLRMSRVTDVDSLYQQLLSETRQFSPANLVHTKDSTPRRSQSLSHASNGVFSQLSAAQNDIRLSAVNFEGIEDWWKRKMAELSINADARRSPETVEDQSIPRDVAEKIHIWRNDQRPDSPSYFKNSEEASPRGHSFPVASPPVSPSSVSVHARKRSVHGTPSHLKSSSLHQSSSEQKDVSDSGSDYSRRRSLDETSAALSDTPALSKLVDNVHTNPFTEADSTIVGRIRRLSTDGLPLTPLGIPTSSSHDNSEPTVPSPLRASFSIDEELSTVFAASPRHYRVSSNSTEITTLLTSKRYDSALPAPNSPTTSSPLRQATSAAGTRVPSVPITPKRAPSSSLSTIADATVQSVGPHQQLEALHQDRAIGNSSTESMTPLITGSSGQQDDQVTERKSTLETPVTSRQAEANESEEGSGTDSSLFSRSWSWKGQQRPIFQSNNAVKSLFSSQSPSPLATPAHDASSARGTNSAIHQSPPLSTKNREPTTPQSSSSSTGQDILPAPLITHQRSSRPTPNSYSSLMASIRPLNTKSKPSGAIDNPTSTPPRSSAVSVSSLASQFEKSPVTHRQPTSSSPSTQRAFANAKAAFDGSGDQSASKATRVRGTVSSGRSNSPSSARAAASATINSSTATSATASSLNRVNSVSQRVMALNERPPWQMPGKAASVSSSKSPPKPTAVAPSGRKHVRPWEKGSQASSDAAQSTRGRQVATGSDSREGSRESSSRRSTASSTTSANAGFIRFGNEMARGAGVRRDLSG